jgi:L-ascorbate metabolism protein UlaG (beta-lactamase superfamily)
MLPKFRFHSIKTAAFPSHRWRSLACLGFAWLCSISLASSYSIEGATPADTFQTAAGPVTITPIHHASLVLEAGGKRIYVDPTPRADFANRPKADLILITDIHGDHMDADTVKLLEKSGTKVIAPLAVSKTITDAQILPNGGDASWDGWTIEAIPMYNIVRGPAPGRSFHPKGRGNGYVLTYGGKRFYIAGDTEGIPEMRELKNIDVAFVPMNLPFTMTPDEAADAVKAFHPKVVYPYHYRNGDRTYSDIQKFKSDLSGTGIDVRLRDWYGKS